MKALVKLAHSSPPAPTDAAILHACKEAAVAEYGCASKALVAGQLLLEKRHSLSRVCHDGKPSHINGRNQHSDGQNFTAWLDSVGIPQRTAYRWMECTARVLRHTLGLDMAADLPAAIEVEGRALPFSQLLQLPLADLPLPAQKIHQDVFAFMADRSLGEAARAAFTGASESSRITRAANGQQQGGSRGEDRRDWPQFVCRKLAQMDTHLAHWDSMTALQRSEITAALVAAVGGEEHKPRHMPVALHFTMWPVELCEALAEALRLRLKSGRK